MCHVSRVTCHLSHVMCQVSPVTCHLSHVKKYFLIFFILKKIYWVVELVGGGSVINGAPSSFTGQQRAAGVRARADHWSNGQSGIHVLTTPFERLSRLLPPEEQLRLCTLGLCWGFQCSWQAAEKGNLDESFNQQRWSRHDLGTWPEALIVSDIDGIRKESLNQR